MYLNVLSSLRLIYPSQMERSNTSMFNGTMVEKKGENNNKRSRVTKFSWLLSMRIKSCTLKNQLSSFTNLELIDEYPPK